MARRQPQDRQAIRLCREDVLSPDNFDVSGRPPDPRDLRGAVAPKSPPDERPRRSDCGATGREQFWVVVPQAFSALKAHVHLHGVAAPGIKDRVSEAGKRPAPRTRPQPAFWRRPNIRYFVVHHGSPPMRPQPRLRLPEEMMAAKRVKLRLLTGAC
jgi:hypothetical protein